jgi:hypothetical protein
MCNFAKVGRRTVHGAAFEVGAGGAVHAQVDDGAFDEGVQILGILRAQVAHTRDEFLPGLPLRRLAQVDRRARSPQI